MKKIGNVSSNRNFNPQNTKPPIPLDVDEVDSAMERFIRQKYEQKIYMAGAAARQPTARVHTGGTGSSDDNPPPPPPKPGRRFGFGLRSSSSALPLSRKISAHNSVTSPTQTNKQSRIFGASIGVTEEGMEWKLVTLKEMGFPDDKRNSSVLKGLNGDLERAIESLVRLGEGPNSGKIRSPVSSQFPSRGDTPVIPEFRSQYPTVGASVQSATTSSPPRAQTAAGTGSSAPTPAYNPFETGNPSSSAQQSSIDSAFASLDIGQPQPQPLFPNATGGYPQHQEQLQQARLQQSMTPPVPQMPQQFSYNNPYAQQQSYNPFVTSAPQKSPQTIANPYLSSQQTIGSPNPFLNQTNVNSILSSPVQTASVQSPFQQPLQQPWIQQQQQQQPPQQHLQQPFNESTVQNSNSHTFSQNNQAFSPINQAFSPINQTFSPINQMFSPSAQTFSPSTQMFSPGAHMFPNGQQSSSFNQMSPQGQYPSHTQPINPQATGRVDKSSILALYNMPQLAPQPLAPENGGSSNPSTTASPQPMAAKLPPGFPSAPQRSVTMPISGNRNPFLSAGGTTAAPSFQQSGGIQHTSQDNLDSGRHSPDAFASLSARFVR